MNAQYQAMPKVVEVLDDNTVVINRGERNGVKKGDKYLIFRLGDEVIDPDTGENLGPIEIVAGRAEVTHVQVAMSTLKGIEYVRTPGKKRIITRDNPSMSWALSTLGLAGREEIEEGPATEEQPIEAKKGDLAKPISSP